MSAFEEQPCVGLFGTCGDSTFRQELFIPAYERLGITYFNPQVEDWEPGRADIEADHLVHDVVQCWPVLGSTYGTGSLAEHGFPIASSLHASTPLPKFIISLVEADLDEPLADEVAGRESARARTLSLAHLANVTALNLFRVSSLEEMLEVSIVLSGVAKNLVELARQHNPAYQRFVENRRANQALIQNARTDVPGE